MKVAVVGGGIGGLAAALALARTGHSVIVREQAPALTRAGAGVQLSPNAVRALRALGVETALTTFAVRPEAVELRRWRDDALLLRTPLGEAAEQRYGAPYWHAARTDLQTVLTDAAVAAGVDLRLGERWSGEPDGADLRIGADGVRSALRAAVHGVDPPRFTGQVAWRGLVPLAALDPALFPPMATVRVGPGRHFVSYRVERGAAVNFVGVVEQAAWPGEGWSEPGSREALAADFAGWPEAVRALIAACNQPVRWAVFDRDPLPRWRVGRATLLGDAAHPIPPFLAQGAAMALEDAVVLARRLAGSGDVESALDAYEAERRPRTTRVLAASRRNATLFHLRGPPAALAHAGLMAGGRLAPGVFGASLDWLYGYDPGQS